MVVMWSLVPSPSPVWDDWYLHVLRSWNSHWEGTSWKHLNLSFLGSTQGIPGIPNPHESYEGTCHATAPTEVVASLIAAGPHRGLHLAPGSGGLVVPFFYSLLIQGWHYQQCREVGHVRSLDVVQNGDLKILRSSNQTGNWKSTICRWVSHYSNTSIARPRGFSSQPPLITGWEYWAYYPN